MSQRCPPDPFKFDKRISTETEPLAEGNKTVNSNQLGPVFRLVELLEKMEDLDPEYQKLIDENFWELV